MIVTDLSMRRWCYLTKAIDSTQAVDITLSCYRAQHEHRAPQVRSIEVEWFIGDIDRHELEVAHECVKEINPM
jgi:hypothetical protein